MSNAGSPILQQPLPRRLSNPISPQRRRPIIDHAEPCASEFSIPVFATCRTRPPNAPCAFQKLRQKRYESKYPKNDPSPMLSVQGAFLTQRCANHNPFQRLRRRGRDPIRRCGAAPAGGLMALAVPQMGQPPRQQRPSAGTGKIMQVALSSSHAGLEAEHSAGYAMPGCGTEFLSSSKSAACPRRRPSPRLRRETRWECRRRRSGRFALRTGHMRLPEWRGVVCPHPYPAA